MTNQDRSIYVTYRPIKRITPLDVREMHGIFHKYYENAHLDIFLNDMTKKTGIFLVRRRSDDALVGFSTIAILNLKMSDGKDAIGLFSGDTIIEREYWGSRALQLGFFKFLLSLKLRNPTKSLFWLLISKGYKTYLLLANNFSRFYPHPEGKYTEFGGMVEQYCDVLFPGYYDRERKLLDFGKNYQRLRCDVAEITDEIRHRYENINYFEHCNPTWRDGTELPCIGRGDFTDIPLYIFKLLTKEFNRRFNGTAIRGLQ